MSEIIRLWIQRKLGIIIQLSPDTFCELTRDGLLLCRILRNYEVINQDQLKMIEKSNVREVCLKNFQEHIVYWLNNINIRLTTEDVIDIIDCQGLSSLSLFYRVFLELHEKDCLTFIAKNRLSEKFRPVIPKYTVQKVKEKPPDALIYSKYKDHLDNSADVIHWLQDRLEMVVSKCKDAREEYMHKLRSRDTGLSGTLSSSSFAKGDPDGIYIPNVSDISIDMTYEELMTEKTNIRKSKKFRPDLQESQKILEKIKQKLKDKAENKVFMKELQKHIMKNFLTKLVDEDLKDFNEDIVEKVLKQSVYEKQMEHKVREIKYEKQNMLRSKQILNDTVSKENEREFVEKLLDKNELLNKDEFQYYLEKERAMQLHKNIYKEKLRIRAERTFRLCDDAIKGICTMAIRLSEYKKFFDEPPTEKTVDKWRKLINVQGEPEEPKVPIEDVVCTDSTKIEYIVHKEIGKQDKLDKKDFKSYMEFEWPWLLQNVTEEQVNEMENGLNILGHIVHQVLNLKYPLPAKPEPPDLPDVSVRVCINGLPDLSFLKVMQKMLTYREILIIQVQDVINFCIDSYKQESNEESVAEEEEEEEQREETYTNEEEIFSKKGSKRFSSKFNNEVDNENNLSVRLSDKCIQTPKFYPDEKKTLSKAAELGKLGFEELTAGNYINDFLMISMFIEYLNSKKDQMKGWVLVNYPTTYEQAVLFEEELSGLELPGVDVKSRLSKSLVDIVVMCDTKNEHDHRRCSKLVKNPTDTHKCLAYDTILTAFINVQDVQGDDTSSEYEIPKQQHEIENCSNLQDFYNNQGCNYSVYYHDFDYFTVKHIAKLIIGDFSLPRKTSVELFGDTIKYLDVDKGEDFKSPISVKHSEKREPDRIEKVTRKSSFSSPKKGSLEDAVVTSGKKSKHAVPILSEDKWTQIPELKIIEVDPQEPPKPGENGWTYENLEISEEIGLILADIWERMEEIYINDLCQVFYQKRVFLNILMPYVDFAKKFVREYITKTDQRQLFLRVFQEKFNEFNMDFRRDKEFKAELHCLIYELKNKFMELADIRMMRAERQRQDLIKESWGPKQLMQLFNNYISGFQIELDRTNDTMSFINDYYTGLITRMPGEAILPKEILPKFNLDYEELDQEVNKIFLSIGSSELNPLTQKIENVYRKVLVIVEKYEITAFSSYEKVKGLFITATSKKVGKAPSKGGFLSVFEPSEKIKQNSQYIIESWHSTLKGELTRIKIRLGILKADLIENTDVIFSTLRNTYHLLYEENRLKYEKEVNNIHIVCRALSLAVEKEVPIQEELILTSDDFLVNPQTILLADPCEDHIKPSDGLVFSINQLNTLIEIFHDLGADGYLPERSFTFLLQDMAVNNDKELLPKEWTQLTGPNIGHFTMKMFGPQHFSCWKDFIIYNLLLPFPRAEDIIVMRNAFIKIDATKTELIDFKNFESIKFWFEVDDKLDSVDSIKKLLFRMYQVDENSTNYTAMLFDFCKSHTFVKGIAKAITVVSGKLVCWNFSIGETFVNETLEQRRLRDEQERVREIKRRENTKFATTIVDDLVDRTVHACDSLIITEITDEDKKENETPIIQRKKVESDMNVPCMCDFDCLTLNENVLSEAKKYPTFDYFIKYNYIETVMSRTFNWRQKNKENAIFYETLKNIFESCRNPDFNNEVLCHALLNNSQFLELFETKKFLIIHPPTVLEKFLVERQLKEG